MQCCETARSNGGKLGENVAAMFEWPPEGAIYIIAIDQGGKVVGHLRIFFCPFCGKRIKP